MAKAPDVAIRTAHMARSAMARGPRRRSTRERIRVYCIAVSFLRVRAPGEPSYLVSGASASLVLCCSPRPLLAPSASCGRVNSMPECERGWPLVVASRRLSGMLSLPGASTRLHSSMATARATPTSPMSQVTTRRATRLKRGLSQKQCPGLGLSGLYRSEYEGYQQTGVAQRMEERGQEPGQPPQLPVP